MENIAELQEHHFHGPKKKKRVVIIILFNLTTCVIWANPQLEIYLLVMDGCLF